MGQKEGRWLDGFGQMPPVLQGHAWVSNICTTQTSALVGPTESVLAELRRCQSPSEGHTCV